MPTHRTSTPARLLRRRYFSAATQAEREYFVYLPVGHGDDPVRRWPVMLFLHGGGERGDGLGDLDWVLVHGPLAEAWLQRRDLPFVIISPQLPVFDQTEQVAMRADHVRPVRLAEGVSPRPVEDRPPKPMVRAIDPEPSLFGVTEAWGIDGAPGGWQLITDELLAMVDHTVAELAGDLNSVYLTGLSYGGYGTWHLATTYPERWTAVAPICGAGAPARVEALVAAQTPIWIFHGGRDPVVKVEWSYDMAAALEAAGHTDVRLTVHEDLGHNVWGRVYAGEDFYRWLLLVGGNR